MSDQDELSIFEMFRMEVEEAIDPLQAGLLSLTTGGANEKTLRNLMRGAHSLKGAARIVGLGPAVQLTHAMEERFVAAQEGKAIIPAEIDTLLQATDVLRSLIPLKEDDADDWKTSYRATVENLVNTLTTQAAGAAVAEAAEVPPAEDALAPETLKVEAQTAELHAQPDWSLRITSQRFDRIIAFASDSLVDAQSMIRLSDTVRKQQQRVVHVLQALLSSTKDTGAAQAILSSISLLEDRLQDIDRAAHTYEWNAQRLHREVLYARLRPFGDVVPGLRRLVREVAAELGKQVQFDVLGERTEVDRDILERLRAPLEHLLRNAIDHGIEAPAKRRETGKAETANLTLRARHENGRLAIDLSDDGAGVVIDAVRDRAVSRNLVPAAVAEQLTEAEVLEFLFLPGFSTRTDVTELSGRGVGLDVVQNVVHEAGGSVRIESSSGLGTSFAIILPVTRSLLRAMLVQDDDETYAIPLARLSRVASLQLVRSSEGLLTAAVEYGSVPALSLASVLHDTLSPKEPGSATVLFFLGDRGTEAPLAFTVDRVLGEKTVAVRALDPRLGKMPSIAGVTLSEANVPILIISPDDVLRIADQNRQRATHAARDNDVRAKILVVDDSPTVRQMLRRTLERAGYRISLAEHGASAWSMLQVESFDLLVSDIDMPEMNGIELVERIRAKPRLAHLGVILLSYKGRDEDRRRGLEAGADSYVTKGEFDETAFLGIVEDLVGPPVMEGGA